MMVQNDNDMCEYSYYIENYYQCVITGEECIYCIPNAKNCSAVRDMFLKKKGDHKHATAND